MPPERSDLVLTADVPDGKGDVFVFHRFHVESDRRNRRHDLTQFQFVQNRGFTGRIQPDLRTKMQQCVYDIIASSLIPPYPLASDLPPRVTSFIADFHPYRPTN